MQEYDIVVVGLGALGSAILHALGTQADGQTILGIDMHPPSNSFGSSCGESRMMRFAHPSGNPVYSKMAKESKDILDEMGHDLATETGTLFISKQANEGSMLRKLEADAINRSIPHEIHGADTLPSCFKPAAMANYSVYHEKKSCLLSADRIIQSRLNAAHEAGVEISTNEALLSFEYKPGDKKVELQTTDRAILTKKLILATGPWVTPILAEYGLSLPVYPASMYWFEVDPIYRASYYAEQFPISLFDVGSGGSLLVFPLENHTRTSIKIAYFPGGMTPEDSTTPDQIVRTVSQTDKDDFYRQFIQPYFQGIINRCTNALTTQYTVGPRMGFVIDFLPKLKESVLAVSACSRQGFKYSSSIGRSIAERILNGSNEQYRDVIDTFKGIPNYDGHAKLAFQLPNDRSSAIQLMASGKPTYNQTISAYAASIFLMAVSFVINAKLIVESDQNGAAAATIVSTFQTLVLGVATGCVLSTGIIMGPPMGERDFVLAGDIAKASWIWTALLGIIASVVLLTASKSLPLTFDHEGSKPAADFFLGYGIGSLPTMFLMTTPQIASQTGGWLVPVVVALCNYVPGSILAYLLGFKAGMGPFGIGLGGGISAWPVAIGLQLWMARHRYSPLSLYNGHIHSLMSHLDPLIKKGSALALQRISEWGNLFILATIASHWSDDYLAAINPSLQVMVLINLASQGVAHGIGMKASANRKAMRASAGHAPGNAKQIHADNASMIQRTTGINMVVNLAFGLGMYFGRKKITDFFIVHGATDHARTVSQNLLGINAIGLLADAPRITLAGGLRGWVDIVWPTMVSLILMTGLAAPFALLAKNDKSDPDAEIYWLFGMRNIAMLLSAIAILCRLEGRIKKDAKAHLGGVGRLSFLAIVRGHTLRPQDITEDAGTNYGTINTGEEDDDLKANLLDSF